MKQKLTKKFIDSLKEENLIDSVVWDTEISGFGLKITLKGKKVFLLKYRNSLGKQCKPSIGDYGSITPEQARDIARQWKARIAEGGDPLEDKRLKKKQMSLNEFYDGYLKRSKAYKKASSVGTDDTNYKNHLRNGLGKKLVSSISKEDVSKWYAELSDKPGAAGKTLSFLSALMNDAEKEGVRDQNSNPCKFIKKYKTNKIERYLSPSELQRLMATLDDIEKNKSMHPVIVPAIKIALLTGARKSEFLGLKWDWIDFEKSIILLPDSKTGSRPLYLSESAKQILQNVPKQKNNPYIFWGLKPKDHYHNLKKPFAKILKLASIENFRIHDLRHTHASYAVNSGQAMPIIAKLLGHSSTKTTERYAHVDFDPALQAAEAVSQAMGI
jgi:integrase